MNEEIRVGGVSDPSPASTSTPRFVPMRVGSATVYVEQFGEPARVEADDRIYPVAALSPQEAFETAVTVLRECVHIVGEQIEAFAERGPQEVTVEFSLSFQATGRFALIPVLLTGESKGETGLKVKAVWRTS